MTSHIDVVLETVDLVSGPDGEHWPNHTHPVHELLSGITRGVSVVTPDAVFIAPPGTSIWIPAGIEHDVRTAAGNRMRCSWFEPIADHALADRVVVATLPPLLNDVLTHLATLEDSEQSRRAEAFAMDLMMGAQTTVHELRSPRSDWLRRVTDAMVADPTDRRSIAEWAAFASVSVRTLARQFQAETGMSLSQWRSELRMRLAMTLLADGVGVGPAARAVGFDSLPAFSAAFRRFAGVSPREFARSTGAVADLQQ